MISKLFKSALLLLICINCLGDMPRTMDDLKKDVQRQIEKDNKNISPRMKILEFEMSCEDLSLSNLTKQDSIIFMYASHYTIFLYAATTGNNDGKLILHEVNPRDSSFEERKLLEFNDIYSNSPQQFCIEDELIIFPNFYKLVYQVQCKQKCKSYVAICVSRKLKKE